MQVTLYTTNDHKSNQVKSFLRDNQVAFREYKVDEDVTDEYVREMFVDVSYPVIIVDGYHINGVNELKEALDSRDNRKLLNEGFY